MSKYTTEVRFICESKSGLLESAGYNSVDEIVTTAAPLIFNFEFPIFDETYRLPLEKRILKHFYTREICAETVGLWQLMLEDKLNLVMPYYNKLYESNLLEFNPLYDVDLRTEKEGNRNDVRNASDSRETNRAHSGSDNENFSEDEVRKENASGISNTSNERTGVGSSEFKDTNVESENRNRSGNSTRDNTEDTEELTSRNSNTNNNDWDLYSDTPQSGLDGIAAGGSSTLANNGYLTSARNQFGDTNVSESGKTNGTRIGNETTATQDDESRTNTTIGNKSENKNESVMENGNRNNVENRNSENNRQGGRNNIYNRNENEKTSGDESSNVSSLEKYAEHVVGKRGGLSYSRMIEEFRRTFLKIDEMLMNDLEELFFGLW